MPSPKPPKNSTNSRTLANSQLTPLAVVRHMSNLCEPHLSDPARKVFEPGCGTGNFLIEALTRRLQSIKTPPAALVALSNLYGVDIDADYLAVARTRLKSLILNHFSAQSLDYRFSPLVDLFLQSNLIHADLLKNRDTLILVDWQKLSDYDFRAVPTCLADMLERDHV